MTRPKHAFRGDIEGLRAWAVSGVVVFHLFAVPFGGVAGVDVFFVISGFLITSSLLREHQRTGSISFGAFALRRIQRLLPAAVPVVLLTAIAAFFVWYLPRAIEVALDALAATTSVANWHFALGSTDYFSDGSTVSPLQHFWSLSVEEQFYAVWPVLTFGSLALTARCRTVLGRRGVVLFLVLAVLAGGFAYALWQTSADPARAYFDTAARSWELGLGALAAVLLPWLERVPARLAAAATTGGLVAIVLAMAITDSSVGFPAPGALPAVLGAGLVVSFGWSVASRGPLAWALASRPLRLVGRLSYSIYLWHFPLHVFATTIFGDGFSIGFVTLVLTVALAWVSHRYVEAPALRWQRPARSLRGRLQAARPGRRRFVEAVVAVIVLVVMVGAMGAQRISDLRYPGGVLRAVGVAADEPVGDAFTSEADVNSAVRTALARSTWPAPAEREFNTTVADIRQDLRECLNLTSMHPAAVRSCSAGSERAERVVTVVGDSTAAAYAPAVERALVPLGWRVETMTFAGCSVLGRVIDPVMDTALAGSARDCAAARERMFDFVAAAEPDLVVASASVQVFGGGEARGLRASSWQRDTAEGLMRLGGPGRTIVDLTAPPVRERITACASRTAGPAVCDTDASRGPNVDRPAKIRAEAAAISEVDARGVQAAQIDVTDWFCAEGLCPAVIGQTTVMYDEKHITPKMSAALAGPMREALTPYLH